MRYLVGVDSSKLSEELFEVACNLIQNTEEDILYIINVWQPTMVYTVGYDYGSIMKINSKLELASRNLLIYFGQKCSRRKIKHRCIIVSGEVGPSICNQIKKYGINMLILGSHEHNFLEKMFLGSASEYCIKHAECSVLVHKQGHPPPTLPLIHHAGSQSAASHPSPSHPQEEELRQLKQWVDPKDFLSAITLHECLNNNFKPFTFVKSSDDAAYIMKVLTEHSISAVPVYDSHQQKWLGFVDMIDIATAVLEEMKGVDLDNFELEYEPKKSPINWVHLRADQFFVRKCPSKEFCPLKPGENLKKALELIITRGLKRFPIESITSDNLISVLSETKILEFLSDKSNLVPFSNKTIEELKLGFRDVIAVRDTDNLKTAVQTIVGTSIHGVGVLDENKRLVGNISVADLKMANSAEELTKMYFLPVKDILARQKQDLIPSPICVQPQSTFEEVLEKFAITRVHRLYIMSEKEQVLGVITMGDVMHTLYSVFQL